MSTPLKGSDGPEAPGSATAHPPIASYVLGQGVIFQPGRGDRWYPGVVTRLESGLRPDRSAWHMIFVSSTHDLPSGEWERSGAHPFEDRDDLRVSPALGDGERTEELGAITVKAGSLSHGFYDALARQLPSHGSEEYRRGYVIGQANPGEPVKYTVLDDDTKLSDVEDITMTLDGAGVPRLSLGLCVRVRWLAQVAAEREEALSRMTREVASARKAQQADAAHEQERRAALQRLVELESSNSRLRHLIDEALRRSAALEGRIERAVGRCTELENKIAAMERVS